MNPKILEIDGWMDETELIWLFQAAERVPENGLIVEIGAWKGRSTAALCTGAENDKRGRKKAVVSIDTWKGENFSAEEAREADIFSLYKANLASVGIDVKPYERGAMGAQYITGDSVEIAKLFDDKSIYVLFVDGDHFKCGEDIDAFLPKMKPDGVLAGHDYFCYYETIQQEIHKRFYIHQVIYSIWVRYMDGGKFPEWQP